METGVSLPACQDITMIIIILSSDVRTCSQKKSYIIRCLLPAVLHQCPMSSNSFAFEGNSFHTFLKEVGQLIWLWALN